MLEEFCIEIASFSNTYPYKYLLVILLIAVFFLLAISLLAYLMIVRHLRRVRAAARIKQQDFYTKALTSFLMKDLSEHTEEEYGAMVVSQFRQYGKKQKFSRKVLYWSIIKAGKSLSGEAVGRMQLIFNAYKLHEFASEKLRNGNLFEKADAMLVLSKMKQIWILDTVKKYLNHQHPTLRVSAQISYLRLELQHPLDFFFQLKHPLVLWHQIQLMEIFKQMDRRKIPRFDTFLNHDQPTVITFCLKMIHKCNQFYAEETIAELLRHAEPEVRLEAIKTIGAMGFEDQVPRLVEYYTAKRPSLHEQIAILQALQSLDQAGLKDTVQYTLAGGEYPTALLKQVIYSLQHAGVLTDYEPELRTIRHAQVIIDEVKAKVI